MMDRWSICEYRNLNHSNHSSQEVWATVEFRMTEGSAREESAGEEVLTEAEALIARRGARGFIDGAESGAGRRRPYERDAPFHDSSHSHKMTMS